MKRVIAGASLVVLSLAPAPARAVEVGLGGRSGPGFVDDALLCHYVPAGIWTGLASAAGAVRLGPDPSLDLRHEVGWSWTTVLGDAEPFATTTGDFELCVGVAGPVLSGSVVFTFELHGPGDDYVEVAVCSYGSTGRHCL